MAKKSANDLGVEIDAGLGSATCPSVVDGCNVVVEMILRNLFMKIGVFHVVASGNSVDVRVVVGWVVDAAKGAAVVVVVLLEVYDDACVFVAVVMAWVAIRAVVCTILDKIPSDSFC